MITRDTFHDASNSTGHRGRFNAIKRVGISYLSRAFSASLGIRCGDEGFLDAEYAPSVIEQSLTESHVSWFVAETDRPVGFMKVTWDAMLPETDKRGVLLNKLYLDPAETGKHYGQDMFNKIIDMARSRGKDSLWLEVLEQNAGAYRFYQKQGMLCIKNVLFETASQQSILRIMGMSL